MKEYSNTRSGVSPAYLRNLIAYYLYDSPKQPEVKGFLQKFPESYKLAEDIWSGNINTGKDPSLRIWQKYMNVDSSRLFNFSYLSSDCSYFGEIFCLWIKTLEDIHTSAYKSRKPLGTGDYDAILKKLEVFINASYFVPFMYQTGNWLPKFLRDTGLSMESAMLYRAMMHRQDPKIQKELQKEFYLSLLYSGDLETFLKYYWKSPKESSKEFPEVSVFNVMMLSKNSSLILKILQNESNLEYLTAGKEADIFTGFPVTKNLVRIRNAHLLYKTGNDEKNALLSLEKVLKDKQINEQEFLYARLIQSVIIEKNPDLSLKIAEDVQYKAQEKGYYLLEYYATLWRGWLLYRQKKYYPSLVEFVKAQNMARRHNFKKARYGNLLGLLLARQKLERNDYAIMKDLAVLSKEKLPDSYFYQLFEWIPESIPYDSWKELYLQYLWERKNYGELINFLLEDYRKPVLFSESQNPGSQLGLATTRYYCRLLGCPQTIPLPERDRKTEPVILHAKTPVFLFYQTSRNLHVFVFSGSQAKRHQLPLQNEVKSLFRQLLDEYSEGIFLLHPFTAITHLDFDGIQKEKFTFSLLYTEPQNIIAIRNSLTKLQNIPVCDYNRFYEKENTGYVIQEMTINESYPLLSRFHCDNSESIRLWDLQRFGKGNTALYLKKIPHRPTMQYLYYIAMMKNWYLIETERNTVRYFEPVTEIMNIQ